MHFPVLVDLCLSVSFSLLFLSGMCFEMRTGKEMDKGVYIWYTAPVHVLNLAFLFGRFHSAGDLKVFQ